MGFYPGVDVWPNASLWPEDGGEVAPTVITGAATGMTAISVTLSGTVNPNGLATHYYWEYGYTTAYGSQTADLVAGSGLVAIAVSDIALVDGAGFYHYRLVAYNGAGFGYGADRTFSGLYGPADLSFIHEGGKGQY